MSEQEIRNEIFQKVKELYIIREKEKKDFVPGESYIPYAGRVYDEK